MTEEKEKEKEEEKEKESKAKTVTLEMSFEDAKAKYFNQSPVRLTELWRENKEEQTMMIMDQESAATYKFNISALEMWKMCSGDHTVEEIVQHICGLMENADPQMVTQDTLGFFLTLHKLGLLGWEND